MFVGNNNSDDFKHSDFEKIALEIINQERKKNNLKPLDLIDNLTKISDLKVREMSKYSNFNEFIKTQQGSNLQAIFDIYNIKKFCEEVIEIEDINKIYNLVYGDGSYSYYELEMIGLSNSLIRIYNNGSIIKSFTIFEEKFKDETSKINIY